MRLVFLGTGDIGLPSLEVLLASGTHELVAVVTQPDKPVGRKMVLTAPQVKVRALAAGIPVLQPERIRHAVQELTALRADVFVVVAYGQILPRTVLDIPKLACLNIHASLLPRHRGAAPIQAAIRDGDTESGVTIMWMDEGLDTGDILLMEKCPIMPDDTGGSLHDKLALLAPGALMRALELVAQGSAPRTPQDHTCATHVRKLEREDGRVDWSRSAVEIEHMVRAFNPWPGTFCVLPSESGNPLHLKIHRATVVPHGEACPVGGTIVSASNNLLVSCGTGVLELLEVQLESKKRMPASEFLRGMKLEAGMRLA
jgi:methionyl-tRNA formyltransferase